MANRVEKLFLIDILIFIVLILLLPNYIFPKAMLS